MSLNAPHSLPQRITAAMLMIRMGHLMLMKYNTGSHQWIFRIMYIPHMSGIPGHDGHIPVIHINNLKIPWIQTFKIFPTKHPESEKQDSENQVDPDIQDLPY